MRLRFVKRMRYIRDMKLKAILRELKLSDAAFASECGKHRTQIWAYRTGRYIPDSATAAKILSALEARGVEMTLADLIARPRKRRTSRKAA